MNKQDRNNKKGPARKRGRPAGKNRIPLSAEERRGRNADYERERRQNNAAALKELAEAVGLDPSSNQMVVLEYSTALLAEFHEKMRDTESNLHALRKRNATLQDQINDCKRRLRDGLDLPGLSSYSSSEERQQDDEDGPSSAENVDIKIEKPEEHKETAKETAEAPCEEIKEEPFVDLPIFSMDDIDMDADVSLEKLWHDSVEPLYDQIERSLSSSSTHTSHSSVNEYDAALPSTSAQYLQQATAALGDPTIQAVAQNYSAIPSTSAQYFHQATTVLREPTLADAQDNDYNASMTLNIGVDVEEDLDNLGTLLDYEYNNNELPSFMDLPL